MKSKAFVLSLVILVSLTGCAYNNYVENLKLFREAIQKILYFYQGNGGGGNLPEEKPQEIDYLTDFKNLLNSGKPFTYTQTSQTDYAVTQEKVYFAGNYLYKFSKITTKTTIISHKLYLENGESYSYNGSVVTKDETVDFISVKNLVLNDLFNESITWQKKDGGYFYTDGDFDYYIAKGEIENSLVYEIRYLSTSSLLIYKGGITLCGNLSEEIPEALKKYI